MKTACIAAEYNVFHNGHKYHIDRTRENGVTHVAAVMSGNFVQRGEPALTGKRIRAKAALLGGADLVIELPLPFAVSGAETFARGCVQLADALGCADYMSFGCETDNIDLLIKTAASLDAPEIDRATADILSRDKCSYAAARHGAVEALLGKDFADVITSPNNILAVEYIRALLRTNSAVEPMPIKRSGAHHDSEELTGDNISASAIRRLIYGGNDFSNYIPSDSLECVKKALESDFILDRNKYEISVLSYLRHLNADNFAVLPDISEGLHNRIFSAVRIACTLDELYSLIKTKRYAHSRIRRIILSAYLGLNAADSLAGPQYIRVLGFNQRGLEILRAAKTTAKLPIVMRASDFDCLSDEAKHQFQLECRSTDLYNLLLKNPLPCGTDMTDNIVMPV